MEDPSSNVITKKSVFKRWWVWTLTLLGILLILALLWGPLFPWGPKLGYVKENHNKVVLIAKDKSDFASISNIDQIIKDEEDFHGLAYKHKVKIIFVENRREWKRFMPYLTFSTGGATLQAGNTIYINKTKIDEHNSNMDGYIKHELSHEILYQNCGFLKAYTMFRQLWLEEGIATYHGGPHDYYANKEEFLKIFKDKNLKPSDNPLLLFDNLKEQGGKFSYTVYRYFFEYLSDNYGSDRLHSFILKYSKNPKYFEQDFEKNFGISIPQATKQFNIEMLSIHAPAEYN